MSSNLVQRLPLFVYGTLMVRVHVNHCTRGR